MQRLYEQFIPEHYSIMWDLHNAHKRKVTGTVQIKGQQVNSDTIRLHAKDLTIDSVYVNDTEIPTLYSEKDELVIPHAGTGEVYVSIAFSLTITDAMHGIYPCYYELNGKQQELFATQFESHHAREAFPCIDEPEAKATYAISLVTTPITVLSNMPIYKQTEHEKLVTTVFETTPRMSSYLVAFAIGDFQRATTKTKSGVEVNVYATKVHPAESLTWALDHAANTIDFFNDYFGVPYPLPKSDHIALPDFSSGAMENWGLVTYREIALLAHPKTATIEGKQYIATVVAHELSHQWFGNLVTMKWWNNLWLNESFATVMEYVAVDALHPDWNIWFDFSMNEGVAALRRDCIDGVQPVQVDVDHPDEISSLFDGAIVYAKGGRLLRMMQMWVGEDAFRKGLTDYFTAHKYGNTSGDDLWSALSKASGKDVGGLMNTWITQPGYPLVRATLDNNTLTLQQEQFFVGPHVASDRLWPIPLDATTSGLPDNLSERSISLPYSSSDALYLNQHNTGHFITLYDSGLRSRIIADILADKLSDIGRAQFLHEQTLLARGGYIESSSLVDLLVAFETESNEKVWDTMALTISDLKRFVENDPTAEKQLRTFVGKLARRQFERLGWTAKPGESENDTKLRSTIIGCMAYSEDEAVIREAVALYETHGVDGLDSELRSVILSTVIRHSKDSRSVDALLETYRNTTSAELKGDITGAVTSTKNPKVIHSIIDLLTNTKLIRQQDTLSWYVNLLRNRDGRDATWQWLRSHWEWVEKTFASDKSHDYFPRYTASILSTRTQLHEYRAFFTPLRSNPALVRAIDMGLLDLEGRIELIERDGAGVAKALSQL